MFRPRSRLFAILFAALTSTLTPGARAQETPGPAPSGVLPPLDARADEVSFNARDRSMLLRGNVVFDDPPFYVRSDQLDVRRGARGFSIQGDGRVGFCPCLGTPVAIAFDGATIAPPGDLLLYRPRLEVFGLPVLWSPFFWLRSPGRVGLLAPEVAYRGVDGMRLGGGVHIPLRADDLENGLDLRGAGYTKGGAAASATLVTTTSRTSLKWDYLGTSGLTLDTHGSFREVAWDADVLRGARGLAETTDVNAASRPFDRLAVEASARTGSLTLAAGMREVNARGGGLADPGMWGPVASARFGDAFGRFGAFDAAAQGGVLRVDGVDAANLGFARGDAGFVIAHRLGPLGLSLTGRASGDAAEDGTHASLGGGGVARAEIALPYERAFPFPGDDGGDPIIHRIEPRVTAAALAVRPNDVLDVAPGRGLGGVRGAAWLAETALYSALGRWGSRAGSELVIAAGAVGTGERTSAIVRWRGATSARWIGAGADVGRVAFAGSSSGGAAVTRYRFGTLDGLHVQVTLSYRDGMDPILARLALDAPVEPSSGILSRTGWNGGAAVTVPWTRAVVTSGGLDADLSQSDLVAARAGIELRDACGCLVLRGTVAHRLGREGVDAWIALDVIPSALAR